MSKLTQYRVVWTIDVSAASAEDAARQARAMQMDPTSIATIFDVHSEHHEDCMQVDLSYMDETESVH